MIHIRFACKNSIKQKRNIWITSLFTSFEKNEFLRNVWFSVHLLNQIGMQIFLEFSVNFYNDWRWHDLVSVYLFHLVKYQSLPLSWTFTISAPPVTKQTYMSNFKQQHFTMMLQIVTFRALTSLSSKYMLFQ